MDDSGTTRLDTTHLLWSISVEDDKDAFRLLFEYYYAPLCFYAKKFIKDKATREDVVQDVFFYVWEKRKSIIVNISVKSYLISSVKNNCLNHLRKQGYLREYQNKFVENATNHAENMDELYNLQELQELLAKTLEKLPEAYRLAFILSRMEGKKNTEIAEIMGVSIRTVERYRNRAIKILKNELKDYLPISLIITLIS